ncbi:competence protein TfoX [Devosia epidermidihirudinis]|uniref:Competence protein TfoX n=1 Tax=Devosia epidermidihirudinis TaxID=1293439 RepID=A0A0F5QK58_9HYPH|nr:TfoX/Sxy family protein [Devosia epidermidihirudinis]KKC41058.1 competence protein TfoX [Devosia epidermidihirudinis]
MGSQKSTLDYIIEQVETAGTVSSKAMFGEYALYCDSKVVAFVCDDQLFIKPTDAGRAFLGEITEGHPYPGSKPYFLIEGDRWDDSDWLSELVRVTAAALPLPKPKAAKKKV